MSTEVGALHYDIDAKDDKLSRALDASDNKVASFGDRLSKKFNSIGQSMTNVGTKMSLGVTLPIVAGAAVAIKAASDLNETMNKVQVAFKKNAAEVFEWSKTSIKSMGLARQSALDAAALFGDMGTGMGLTTKKAAKLSMGLTQLGADLASFKNISFERAQTALAGVYTGETEALKGLGIVMTEANLTAFAESQGIKSKIKDLTQAEKVQLRYNFVMNATKNAQGDFARTADGTANQLRMNQELFKELSATIGAKLLPIVNKMLGFFTKLMEMFYKLTPLQQNLALAMLAVAAAAGPVLMVLGSLFKLLGLIVAHPIVALLFAIGAALVYLHVKFGILNPVINFLKRKFDELKPVFERVATIVKTQLVPALVDMGKRVIQWFIDNKQTFMNIWNGFVNVLKTVWSAAKSLANIFMTWMWPSIKALAATLAESLFPALKQIWESVTRLWKALNPALMTALKVVGVIIGVVLIGAIWLIINVFNVLVKTISLVIRIVTNIIKWIANLYAWFGNLGASIINFVKKSVAAFTALYNAVGSIRGKVMGALGDAVSWLYNAGKNIVMGLANGIRDAVGHATNAIKGVVQKVRDFLPFSPAKVGPFSGKGWTPYSGRAMMQGLAQGINAAAHMPRDAMHRALSFNAMSPVNAPQMAGAGGNSGQTALAGGVSVSIGQINNTQDADYLLREIDRKYGRTGSIQR